MANEVTPALPEVPRSNGGDRPQTEPRRVQIRTATGQVPSEPADVLRLWGGRGRAPVVHRQTVCSHSSAAGVGEGHDGRGSALAARVPRLDLGGDHARGTGQA